LHIEESLIVNRYSKIFPLIDALLTALVVALVLGSALCFGGVVWWFRPVFAALALALSLATLVRFLLERRLPILKSPLTLLAFLALGLGLLQLISLPVALAYRLSPKAQEIYSLGVISDLARADLPSVELGEPAHVRSPVTLDRAATLRWLVGTLACLGVFWAVSHFADRLKRLYLVWGCVLAAFLLNGAFSLVQITGSVEGLFGCYRPGTAPIWAPSSSDLLDAPSSSSLRRLSDTFPSPSRTATQLVVVVPDEPVLMGTMVASSGAFLAFGSLSLPLGLAIILHMLSSRGSREPLSSRLSYKGQGSLIVLLLILLVSSAFLVGMASGPRFCLPFLAGVAAVGLTSAVGLRGWAITLMALLLASVGLGAALGNLWPVIIGGSPPITSVSWERALLLWTDSLAIIRDFPVVGAGFGSFSAIHPYVKTRDPSSNTAMSSLLQWTAESGVLGLMLLIGGVLWVLYRLPGVIKRVGSADRTLAYGLIGAAVGFSLWSVVHWTVELPAVAISASALGGTWNRWLAGGTDLFVDRG
jgi:hypothetical protein